MTLNAFPSNLTSNTGMTLRDYFAAKAMAAFIGRDMATEIDDRRQHDWLAVGAYSVADAMLKVREQGEQS